MKSLAIYSIAACALFFPGKAVNAALVAREIGPLANQESETPFMAHNRMANLEDYADASIRFEQQLVPALEGVVVPPDVNPAGAAKIETRHYLREFYENIPAAPIYNASASAIGSIWMHRPLATNSHRPVVISPRKPIAAVDNLAARLGRHWGQVLQTYLAVSILVAMIIWKTAF